MTFNIFLPDDEIANQRGLKAYPVLYYLSGLTCTPDNVVEKSGYAAYAQKHGIAMVFPDTSPRGLDFPEVNDNSDWKIGYGAGNYCDATQAPWKDNFNMYTYVTEELPEIVNQFFPVDADTKSIMGHSMGGAGALSIALRNSGSFRSVSAFSPIANPVESGFCKKAFTKYFGNDKEAANQYSPVNLIKQKVDAGVPREAILPPAMIMTGTSDPCEHYLESKKLKDAAAQAQLDLTFTMQPGYDHSYNFISSFMEEHIAFHSMWLKTGQ